MVASQTRAGSVVPLARTILRGDIRLELRPADVRHQATGYQERYPRAPMVVEEHARYTGVERHLADRADPLYADVPFLVRSAADSRGDEQDHGRKAWYRHGEAQGAREDERVF